MRIKGFGCKEPVSWKPVFLISKYVGVSGLSFATKTNSGKAGIFLIHGRIGRKILHLGQLEPLLPCRFPLEAIIRTRQSGLWFQSEAAMASKGLPLIKHSVAWRQFNGSVDNPNVPPRVSKYLSSRK
jgi:hypothetical protein